MNRILEKLRNMGCKVKKNQCFTDYVSYLSTKYFVIFLEYGSCPVKPLLSSNFDNNDQGGDWYPFQCHHGKGDKNICYSSMIL
jgi:hypothetical protein